MKWKLLEEDEMNITDINNLRKRKVFKKYRVTNAREVAQLTETLKQKMQAKAKRIRRYEKRETQ